MSAAAAWVLILTLMTSHGASVTHVPMSSETRCLQAAELWARQMTAKTEGYELWRRASTACVPG